MIMTASDDTAGDWNANLLDTESTCYCDRIMQCTRLSYGGNTLSYLVLRCVFHAEAQNYVHYSTEENDDEEGNQEANSYK